MRILHHMHGPEHCFLYHLIRALHLVNISGGVYSGIQWDIYIKPFDTPPPPPPALPSSKPLPVHRANLGSQRPKENFKALFLSQNDQIDRSPISRARYLYKVSTECFWIQSAKSFNVVPKLFDRVLLQKKKIFLRYRIRWLNENTQDSLFPATLSFVRMYPRPP